MRPPPINSAGLEGNSFANGARDVFKRQSLSVAWHGGPEILGVFFREVNKRNKGPFNFLWGRKGGGGLVGFGGVPFANCMTPLSLPVLVT